MQPGTLITCWNVLTVVSLTEELLSSLQSGTHNISAFGGRVICCILLVETILHEVKLHGEKVSVIQTVLYRVT